jgi:uncharacterized protein YbaR (Trm112 family)
VTGARNGWLAPSGGSKKSPMAFDHELASLLACPKCKGPVELAADESGFACQACRLLYPVEDGIPNFLIEEAKPLDAPPPG